MTFPFGLDPHERDPGGWCASLLHSAEILLGCLDAVQARSVAEVGAFMGELTRLLMLWADTVSGNVVAIDPSPHPDLEQLERERDDLQLIRETSHEALAQIPLTDAITTTTRSRRSCGSSGSGSARNGGSCRSCCCTTSAGLTAGATTTTCPSGSRPSTASRSHRSARCIPTRTARGTADSRTTIRPRTRADLVTEC
jgi:hypothetical protein